MDNLWIDHIRGLILVNKYNRLDNKYRCNIYNSELLLNEYIRKLKMKPFDFEGHIQFLRSIRDLLIPLTINSTIRVYLYSFLKEANKEIKKIYNNKYSFYIHSGYRSYKYQMSMYENTNNDTTAIPGSSEHQTGLSIDFGLRYGKYDCDLREKKYESAVELLKSIASNFGFILRYPKDKKIFTGYPEEKWHFRYVGDKARLITDYNLSYEEYAIATFITNNNISFDEFLQYNYLERCIGDESAKRVRNNHEYLNDLLFFLENNEVKKISNK